MSADLAPQPVLERLLELGSAGVPVMRATVAALEQLERAQERTSSAELSAVILRDPLMSLRVLHFLYRHRTRSQTKDITTIAHALMMLGMARFFREFSSLPAIEDSLAGMPEAVMSVRASASRARLASLFARDWATARHDMDAEEVMVAALVHDVVELLLVCAWPSGAPCIARSAQSELRTALFSRMGLPGLLAELTLDGESQHPRVLNVAAACDLARCCAQGWNDPRIELELARIQRLLHISAAELWDRVRKVALQAAREWQFYQVRPAAAYLPMQSPAESTAEKTV